MEIKKDTQRMIRDFLPVFRRRAIENIILGQITSLAAVAAILILTGTLQISSPILWAVIGAILLIEAVSSASLLHYTSRPTKDLIAAVIHVSGETTSTTPPNPNDKRYQNSGFKQALQAIYELASDEKPIAQTNIAISNTPVPTKSLLESALDETLCGFVVLNHDRKITFANKAAPTHISTDGSAVLGVLFNGNDTLDAWLDDCEQHAVHAEHIWTRIPDRMPEEEGRHIFDVMASYDKGSANEIVLTFIDRTASYLVNEEDLDFIAFAAHELRGPITVIKGYLDVLEDELSDVLQPDQHELFHRLTVSANRLSGYINNILNTSRYDRRHLKARLSEDSISAIYDTIKDDMLLRAQSQNRLLSVSFPADLPNVAADRASISEVMGNLIDNAIKYSSEGGAINVTASVKGDFVEISFEDHGIGMPGNVVSNLFQKFYRSHRSRETVAGTGIGLYISKAIVESHGGTIGVRSVEGEGSTFTVDIPIYATIADKLKADDNNNEGLIEHGNGWIKNHSMYRG